mmetsp:Transcript_13805/g.31034  ORF Transcript_13805/g.31034 Transcript_13805/m.31034 type:complete len:120 (+) Transcript_13805:271-630(+)
MPTGVDAHESELEQNFDVDGFDIVVANAGKRHALARKVPPIMTARSSCYIKSRDTVVVKLRKQENKEWKDLAPAKPDISSAPFDDPRMAALQQVYDQGDEKVKAALNQAWEQTLTKNLP